MFDIALGILCLLLLPEAPKVHKINPINKERAAMAIDKQAPFARYKIFSRVNTLSIAINMNQTPIQIQLVLIHILHINQHIHHLPGIF